MPIYVNMRDTLGTNLSVMDSKLNSNSLKSRKNTPPYLKSTKQVL